MTHAQESSTRNLCKWACAMLSCTSYYYCTSFLHWT